MAVNGVIAAVGILSGALVYGQTASEMDFPKEINEGVYNVLPAYAHEVNWSNNTMKVNELYAAVVDNYKESINKDNFVKYSNADIYQGIKRDDSIIDSSNNNDDNKSVSSRVNGGNSRVINNSDSDLVMTESEYQELISAYKSAGYEHFILRFPVGEYEPLPVSKEEFFNLLPLSDITAIDVLGFASPDGKRPEMQEELSESRMYKVLDYLVKEDIKADVYKYYLCSSDVQRDRCWRVDIFFKTDKSSE